MKNLINRPLYLDKLKRWKDKSDIIKIVTGIRRCGKSTLFKLFQNHLYDMGIDKEQIINLNLEAVENSQLLDYKTLHQYIESVLIKDKMNYVFLDEIQLVADFPKTINSLRLRDNIDLYATGSNAYMFSQKIITLLSGRFIEIKIQPLSFKEYYGSFENSQEPLSYIFAKYLSNSSFPQTIAFNDDKSLIRDYLVGLYNTIIQKDIVLKEQVKDVSRLENVVRFLFDNIGNETSINNISKVLLADGRKIHPQTIESYIQGLIDCYLLYRTERYDIKGKQYLKSNSKYYVADIGLRYALLGEISVDKGHILENIVYLELLTRGYRVSVGAISSKEVDFIAQKPDGIVEYYQVSQTVQDKNTLKRELAPLSAIDDNYPKFLLTQDYDNISYKGIQQRNLIQWLIED
ncbi:MAG: ATP-binding protein [Endomicrobium sp.]|jgi:predicted AAA+ superfamily ATPase|nr:ATP-binding protein [Endomicrobium sp.]